MLKFNRSNDGATRATVRIDFRVELETVAMALAQDAIASGAIPATWHTYIPENYTKADVDRIVRDKLYVHGPVEQWTEIASYGDEDWDEALEAATDHVKRLWRIRG